MSSLARRTEHRPPRPARLLHGGGHMARLRSWPGDPTIAQLQTTDSSPPPIAVLRAWLGEARTDGYRALRTGAVSELRTAPYDALRFTVVQRLVLLHLDLNASPCRLPAPRVRLRRAANADLVGLAHIDQLAFPAGWGLDSEAIRDAAAATPRSRIRLAGGARKGIPTGYAVSGRAGRAAFLQRLAVAPSAQGQGVGAALVADGIAWARRWRCQTMAVNTQEDNTAALHLYGQAGFVARPHGLVVLEYDLAGTR